MRERLENPVRLYQVPAWLMVELPINYLEDDAHRAMMTLPEEDWASLHKIVVSLEGLFGENVRVPELRWRFFVQRQQDSPISL